MIKVEPTFNYILHNCHYNFVNVHDFRRADTNFQNELVRARNKVSIQAYTAHIIECTIQLLQP